MKDTKEKKVTANLIKAGIVLGLAAVFSAPWVAWQMQAARDLDVVIVDKTVPMRNYREHSSLVWALNHLKVKAPERGNRWQLEKDYIGYYPPAAGGPGGVERVLTGADLAGKDILFIADTYGVYRQDVEESHRKKAADYSPRIIGGIEPKEADAIEAFVKNGGTLIGEFNTFATPTPKDVRARMENIFRLKWKGWAGRYFDDLGHPTDVPAWAHRKWKAQTGKDWDFKGPGWIVDHEESLKLLVLRVDKEVGRKGMRILKTGDHALTKNVDTDIPFYFWFDVNEAQPGATVLAEYKMDLTPEGRKIWQEAGLPLKFPALTAVEYPSLRVYMAGDASDTDLILGPTAIAGRQEFESLGTFKHFQSDQGAFFWELYLPVLRNVFDRVHPGGNGTVQAAR